MERNLSTMTRVSQIGAIRAHFAANIFSVASAIESSLKERTNNDAGTQSVAPGPLGNIIGKIARYLVAL